MFGAFAPVLQRPDLNWTQTILSAFALMGQYLGKLLWPVHLNAFYVFEKKHHFPGPASPGWCGRLDPLRRGVRAVLEARQTGLLRNPLAAGDTRPGLETRSG